MEKTLVLGQHRVSGEFYIILMDEESVITSLCGPLTQAEAREWLTNGTQANLDDGDAGWANEQEWHYPIFKEGE
jgi:hypothetical protein